MQIKCLHPKGVHLSGVKGNCSFHNLTRISNSNISFAHHTRTSTPGFHTLLTAYYSLIDSFTFSPTTPIAARRNTLLFPSPSLLLAQGSPLRAGLIIYSLFITRFLSAFPRIIHPLYFLRNAFHFNIITFGFIRLLKVTAKNKSYRLPETGIGTALILF